MRRASTGTSQFLPPPSKRAAMRILVTGATGYIGGRLIPRLLERGHTVRVLVRDVERIRGRPWTNRVEVVVGDLLARDTLRGLCDGVDAGFYLVHSMCAGSDFARRDIEAAESYVHAARCVPLTVYLGGLANGSGTSSPHLRSRAEVGATLRAAVPTTEIQAGPIIGSGSASFELVRYLTERHPFLIVPDCASNHVQPIALRDVLSYLVAAVERDPLGIIQVGGARLCFINMLLRYAALRDLRRRTLAVPGITPRMVALWAGVATPVPFSLAGPLLQGMLQPVIADTRRAKACFPHIEPLPYSRAVELALERIEVGYVETRWTGALGTPPSRHLLDAEGMMREVRTRHVAAPPERIHDVVAALGGERGWLVWNRVWWLRGLIDRLLGGPGLRRGRRDPRTLLQGEAVDFWRVERVERATLIRLRAEMKVPGRAWLQWEAFPEGRGARLIQTAIFEPAGLAGFLYWYLLYPLHAAMFSRLACAVERSAVVAAATSAATCATPSVTPRAATSVQATSMSEI